MLRGLVTAWKIFCYSLGTLVAGVLLVQLWFFGHVVYWSWYDPASTAFMERQAVQVQQQWVPYGRISVHLKRAVVAAEDARFLDHDGFDWQAIQLAMAKNEERGKLVAGASTISQQLAKNLFLSGERSWIRKAEEAAITWMLEHTLSKRRILELYLNVAEWGDGGVFGVEAAARYHFGVPASALSQDQAAWLAGGWGGDRYRILGPGFETLVWYSAWDNSAAAARFAKGLERAWARRPSALAAVRRWEITRLTIDGRPLVRLVDAPVGWAGWSSVPRITLVKTR